MNPMFYRWCLQAAILCGRWPGATLSSMPGVLPPTSSRNSESSLSTCVADDQCKKPTVKSDSKICFEEGFCLLIFVSCRNGPSQTPRAVDVSYCACMVTTYMHCFKFIWVRNRFQWVFNQTPSIRVDVETKWNTLGLCQTNAGLPTISIVLALYDMFIVSALKLYTSETIRIV